MRTWFKELDRILRGDATRPVALRQGSIDVPIVSLTILLVILGMVYGLCMGTFGLFNRDPPNYWQLLASTLKVPALFALTLLVTTPSLYVFNALVGSRLSFGAMVRLLIAALAVMLAVLASFGPIIAFFSITTPSYSFMSLLNVLFFAVAGVLGLAFLLQTLHRLSGTDEPIMVEPVVEGTEADVNVRTPVPVSALERAYRQVSSRQVKAVFSCWMVVFALVGAQMSWVLRPFIGDPNMPFTWFRARESNFLQAVWKVVVSVLG